MTELERKAVLGDKQAQKKCTEKGIILPCPKCFNTVKVHGPEDWKPSLYDPDSGGDHYEFYCKCGLVFCTSKYDFKEALSAWNTRPTPPVGRCDQCKYWRGEPGEEYAPCPMCDGVMCADDYCKNFIDKE